MPKRARLVPPPVDGIADDDAPHWRGDTARRIVRRRLREIAERPPRARRSRRNAAGRSTGGDPRTRELRRLERNLPRRKTLAARQRIAARIAELKRELGVA